MVEVPSDDMEIAEEVNELESISRCEIRNPRLENCAFSVWSTDDAEGTMNPIGNLFQLEVGWSVKVDIDAGRYGLPHMELIFRVNKPRKDKQGVFTDVMQENVSTKAAEYHDFTATWRPGVRVQSAFMLDHMRTQKLIDSPLPEFPVELPESFQKKQKWAARNAEKDAKKKQTIAAVYMREMPFIAGKCCLQFPLSLFP